jgi:hypothetical protein
MKRLKTNKILISGVVNTWMSLVCSATPLVGITATQMTPILRIDADFLVALRPLVFNFPDLP